MPEEYSTKRVTVPAMEEILGMEFPVLDQGFVMPVDYIGGDLSIVQAARVSYGIGTKKTSTDRGLIRYLMRGKHTTPFEMAGLKLHIKVPMDTWRQWIRHRTASVNEYSTRYSVAIKATQKTPPEEWRYQSQDNKQGSQGFFPRDLGEEFSKDERKLQEHARAIYQKRINQGMAREQARKDLPLSTYTETYWKMDLHNLFHFLKLRMDNHAQFEIRQYANTIGREIVSKWVPLAWEAFEDYDLNSLTLTRPDIELMRKSGILNSEIDLTDLNTFKGTGFMVKDGTKLSREGREFNEKIRKIRGK
ncbi:Flavin-dependent thymidylate synthase [subsurface metagenome]